MLSEFQITPRKISKYAKCDGGIRWTFAELVLQNYSVLYFNSRNIACKLKLIRLVEGNLRRFVKGFTNNFKLKDIWYFFSNCENNNNFKSQIKSSFILIYLYCLKSLWRIWVKCSEKCINTFRFKENAINFSH